jgi:hypothetical protein
MGKSKQYRWDDYIRVRQEAHLELELLEAPVDEGRKVDLMLANVMAEALGPVILAIKANGAYANDFDAAQQWALRRTRKRCSVQSLPWEPGPAVVAHMVAEAPANVRAEDGVVERTRGRRVRLALAVTSPITVAQPTVPETRNC